MLHRQKVSHNLSVSNPMGCETHEIGDAEYSQADLNDDTPRHTRRLLITHIHCHVFLVA